jgi:superfamily I DNA/RNA helicase
MVEVKAKLGQLDFQDLVLLSLRLLESRKAEYSGAGDWRPPAAQFKRVFVDEAQDINRLQSRLIELLAPEGKYYSVGDAAQSIYRFRHADVEIFEERKKTLEKVGRSFELKTNYRSASPILEVNNHIFATQQMRGLVELAAYADNQVDDLRVEMILADADRVKERLNDVESPPDWLEDVVDSGWRYVEAAAVAERI